MPHVHARTTPETAAKIREMFLAGEKVAVIAVECGVSTLTVVKLTGDLPRRHASQEAKRVRIVALASEGMSVADIAREVGCPIKTVRRALRPRPLTREEEDARLAARDAARAERRKAARCSA